MLLTAKGRGAQRDLGLKSRVCFYRDLILCTGDTNASRNGVNRLMATGTALRSPSPNVHLVKSELKNQEVIYKELIFNRQIFSLGEMCYFPH